MSDPGTVYPIDLGWPQRLHKTPRGEPRANLFNAALALRHAPEWQGVLATNELTYYINARKPTPWGTKPDMWTDTDDLRTTEWLQQKHILVDSRVAREAIYVVGAENKYHPVREYLESLNWDGQPRIDTWLTDFMQADPDPDVAYVSAVGAKFLISAVARAYEPGCQVDTCLVIQGKQGIGKSTAVKILAGPWFADQMSHLASKDASMQTRVWIMELAEFEVALKSDNAQLKAFLSRGMDHFRPPYGRRVIDVPRHCIFAGTVNQDDYLRDESGGRRFWPVKINRVNRDLLAKQRDQLWAEAFIRYHNQEQWHLDAAMELIAEKAQAECLDQDPWTSPVLDYCVAKMSSGSTEITVGEILEHAIHKEIQDWTDVHKQRVGRIMIAAQWKKRRGRSGSNRYYYYTNDPQA